MGRSLPVMTTQRDGQVPCKQLVRSYAYNRSSQCNFPSAGEMNFLDGIQKQFLCISLLMAAVAN
ncbi:hypothetical protein EMIT0P4_400018 [Pseudomonas sp. IT-P4]